LERDQRRRDGYEAFLAEVEEHSDEGWKDRMKAVPLDIRYACRHASAATNMWEEKKILIGVFPNRMMGECQAVVAEAAATFGRVDILLCCTSQGKNSRKYLIDEI
jgi:NAD(P)-dependent dehydrogenase (short-subunit alcohol dehydrogenase family)